MKRAAEEGFERVRGDHYHKWTRQKDKRLAANVHGAFKDLRSKTRIPCFPDGRGRFILTHLIEGKKEDQLPEADKLKTLAIVEEYRSRKKTLEERKKSTTPSQKVTKKRGRR